MYITQSSESSKLQNPAPNVANVAFSPLKILYLFKEKRAIHVSLSMINYKSCKLHLQVIEIYTYLMRSSMPPKMSNLIPDLNSPSKPAEDVNILLHFNYVEKFVHQSAYIYM
jgi:hypothetical protein